MHRGRASVSDAKAASSGADAEEIDPLDVSDGQIISSKDAAASRKSPCSVGKYNQWQCVDANRRQAVAIREEEAMLQKRLADTRAAYHKARVEKTATGRGQQEFTRAAVKEFLDGNVQSGEQGRAEFQHLRTIATRQKKEWVAHGARNAVVHGMDQKKKVLEARAERFQARRNAALATKQKSADLKVQKHAWEVQHACDQKARLERARANAPTAASLAEAREFFFKQRRDAAAAVRKSVGDWESAHKADINNKLARATHNRNVVMATRQQANNNRTTVKESRQDMARKIRSALEEMEKGRLKQIEQHKQLTKDIHGGRFGGKFVNEEEQEKVENSEYGALVSSFRGAGMNSSVSVASRPGSSPPGLQKGDASVSGKSPNPLPVAWQDFSQKR